MTLVVIITLLISEWPGKWILFKLPHITAKRNRVNVIQECNIPYVQEKPGFLNDTGGGSAACGNQIYSRYYKYTRMKSGGRTICAVRCNMS